MGGKVDDLGILIRFRFVALYILFGSMTMGGSVLPVWVKGFDRSMLGVVSWHLRSSLVANLMPVQMSCSMDATNLHGYHIAHMSIHEKMQRQVTI